MSSEPIIPVTTASYPKIVVPEPNSNPTYTPDAIDPADTNSTDSDETAITSGNARAIQRRVIARSARRRGTASDPVTAFRPYFQW